MKKFVWAGVFCVAGITTVLIAEQKNDPKTGAQPSPARDVSQNADDQSMQNMSPDQKFVNCVALSNLMEIQGGKLALEKAQNDRVKKLAQQMVDEHTRSNEQLKQAAAKLNLRVPDKLMSWQQGLLDQVAKMPADDIESGYSFHLVGSHHTAILETQYALKKLQDPGLKEIAQNRIRDLQKHLQEVNTVAMQFTGGQPAISGTPVSPENDSKNTNQNQSK